jgi:hypothetical protein
MGAALRLRQSGTTRRLSIRSRKPQPAKIRAVATYHKRNHMRKASVAGRSVRDAPYGCSIDTSTPTNATNQSNPAAIACMKKPVSRFSAASL